MHVLRFRYQEARLTGFVITQTVVGDNVPHISETRIRIVADGVEQTAANKAPYWYQDKVLEIEVDGRSYHLGCASGDGFNCLIDTLRQALPSVMCSVAAVRSALEDRHRGLPTEIVRASFYF